MVFGIMSIPEIDTARISSQLEDIVNLEIIYAKTISILINLLMHLQKPMKSLSRLKAQLRSHCQEQKARQDYFSVFPLQSFYVLLNNLGFRRPSQKREQLGKQSSTTKKQDHFSQNDTSRISSFAKQIMESLSPSKKTKNIIAKDDEKKFEKERQEKVR